MSLRSRAENRDSFLLRLPDQPLNHIARLLPPGEAAYNLRPVCKALARDISSKELLTVSVGNSRPAVPVHALVGRWGKQGSCCVLTYKQRVQVLVEAARNGDVDALEQLSHSTGCLPNEDILRAAASTGHRDVCSWLLEGDCALRDMGAWVLAVAAENGHTSLCKRLYRAGFSLNYHYTGRLAARAGQEEVLLKWLQYQSASSMPYANAGSVGMPEGLQERWWANAAYSGHLELMRKLKGKHAAKPADLPAVAHGCPLAVLQGMVQECAGSSGTLTASQHAAITAGAVTSPRPDWQDKVTWLLQEQGHAPIRTLDRHSARDFAALPDAVQRLNWLAARGFGLQDCRQLLGAAVEGGREELVGAMRIAGAGAGQEPDREWGVFATALVNLAVEKGHLSIARELHSKGLPVALGELGRAAGSTGRVDVVQWAMGVMREQKEKEAAVAAAGAAASSSTGDEGASGSGNLRQGQGQGRDLEIGADGAVQIGVAGWATGSERSQAGQGQATGLATEMDLPSMGALMDGACGSGSLELVRWLRALGVPWATGQLCSAVKSGNQELVQWMVEQQGFNIHEVSLVCRTTNVRVFAWGGHAGAMRHVV